METYTEWMEFDVEDGHSGDKTALGKDLVAPARAPRRCLETARLDDGVSWARPTASLRSRAERRLVHQRMGRPAELRT